MTIAMISEGNKRISLIALCLGFFMVIIDVTIVNVALPTIAKSLNGGISWLQWVVDGYTLTFACLLLSAGHVADKVGAKAAFLWGLGLFALTSLACGMSFNFLLLTIFRLLQGAAAALLVPTSLALINASYRNRQERARAIGVWGSIGGIAAASGPLLGAILTAWFSWRAVFFVNIPIGVIGILLTLKYVPNPIGSGKNHFDFLGQIIGIISVAALAFALIEAGRLGWLSELVIVSFVIFLVAFVFFLLIEHRASSPMFPLRLFESQTFSASIFIGMVLSLGFYGVLFFLPLYFQQLRGYSVLMTGLAILPLPGLAAISSYFAGRVVSVTGPQLPIVIGLTLGAIAFFTLLMMGEHSPPYFLLILPLAAVGLGGSFTMPAATIAALNAVPERRGGIASGAFNTSRQIGTLIGVAISGTTINTAPHFIAGVHITLIICGVAYLCGSAAALLFIRWEDSQ